MRIFQVNLRSHSSYKQSGILLLLRRYVSIIFEFCGFSRELGEGGQEISAGHFGINEQVGH